MSFGLFSRTVAVEDIAVETAAQPPVKVRIARFAASGVGQPDATQFSADSIEATGIELDAATVGPPSLRVVYKAPRITVKDYSGPAGLQGQPASSSITDIYQFAVEQFARVSASSVAIPNLVGTINLGGAMAGGGEYVYSGLSLQGIKDGKIAAFKADGAAFTISTQQAGKAEKLAGKLTNVASYDIDTSAAATVLDPQKANDDRAYRVYRQISAGSYTVRSESGPRMAIDGFTMDDIGVRPSRIQLPALLALLPSGGAAPTPAQTRDVMEKAAGIYEGVRIGNAEFRGMSMETPGGP